MNGQRIHEYTICIPHPTDRLNTVRLFFNQPYYWLINKPYLITYKYKYDIRN